MLSRTVMGAAALLGMFASMVGCSNADQDGVGSAEGAATSTSVRLEVGVPRTLSFGEMSSSFSQITIATKADNTPLALQRPSAGTNPLVISGFGKLDPISDQTTGWAADDWTCQKAEEFALGTSTVTDASQLCRIELNGTGGYGLSVTVIGLDESGKGLSSWSPTTKGDAPTAVDDGTAQPITKGPPQKVNVTIDHDGVVNAMNALHKRFNASIQDRNNCLRNARAASWLDAQSHYYCLLPYSSVRTCYSTTLISSRNPKTAYDTCFAPPPAGKADSRTPDAKWLHENQEAAFKYLMFVKQGAADFEIDSENEAINDYYKGIGEDRPRRVNDTYPSWLANQPRYEAIRKQQADAQKQASSQ